METTTEDQPLTADPAPAHPADGEVPEADPPLHWGLAVGVRIVSHTAVWAAVLVPTLTELARGWRAFGDDAAIASRSFQVFSMHIPLTGLASSASIQTGHTVFDPGPMLFFLLSAPVRIDPAHGLMWGAALWTGIALSVAVEAGWSVARWVGAAAVALVVLDLLWLTPQVFDNLPWNAYLPVPFMVAAVATAIAVSTGATRWGPVLVVSASVAAETHLIFVIPAIALVVVSLVLGLVVGEQSVKLGWVWTGLVVGVACWLAPLVQQLEGPHGNVGTILHSAKGQRTFGAGFGFREIGMAANLHPIWLIHLPQSFLKVAHLETDHAPWYGAFVLALLVVGAVAAYLTGRRSLGALCATTAVVGAGFVASFAVFPTKNGISLDYLVDFLWVVGILMWVAFLWGLGAIALSVARTVPRIRVPILERVGPWIGLAAVLAGMGAVGVAGLSAASNPAAVGWNKADSTLSATAAKSIEQQVPAGPVSLDVETPNFFTGTWATEAIAFRLETDGWVPNTGGDPATYTGLVLHGLVPEVATIHLSGLRVASVSVQRSST